MTILTGIKNVLQFINDNWTAIMIVIGLGVTVFRKAKDFFSKSNDEKVEIAKAQIQEIILKLVTEAEIDYEDWVKAGAVKRSQVVAQIFEAYPELSKVTNQEELIAWIDDVIDEALKTMREIVSANAENKEV